MHLMKSLLGVEQSLGTQLGCFERLTKELRSPSIMNKTDLDTKFLLALGSVEPDYQALDCGINTSVTFEPIFFLLQTPSEC